MFVWLAAGQARAEAPLCDQRGATVFAPAPQLQDEELALSIGDANDCSSTPDEPTSLRDSKDGRPLWSAGESDHASPISSIVHVQSFLLNVLPGDECVSRPSEGASRTLERPPRALTL